MMAPDVVVMETSAEAAELLVFLSAGGFSRTCAVCLLVVEARRRAEAERWRCKMANKRPFLGKGIPTQQPNTFHSHPKNANRNLCHLKWTASSGESERLLPLLLSVSIQKQQVVGPGKTSTFLGFWACSFKLLNTLRMWRGREGGNREGFVRAWENV